MTRATTEELIMLRAGDEVTRWLGGEIPLTVMVTSVSDTVISCGDWEFCRETGVEIDELFGPIIVSYLGSTK